MNDLIKREDAISRAWIKNTCKEKIAHYKMRKNRIMAQKSISYDPKPQIEGFDDEIAIYEWILREVDNVPSAEKQDEWIPCSERLPENIRPVLVTWKNNDPASYYQYIVGKHFIGTAHYHRGKWYWYSSVTEDLLAEYGKCETEEFDEAIEAVAWMPLPEPWKGADDD